MSDDRPPTWSEQYNKGFYNPYGVAGSLAEEQGQEDARPVDGTYVAKTLVELLAVLLIFGGIGLVGLVGAALVVGAVYDHHVQQSMLAMAALFLTAAVITAIVAPFLPAPGPTPRTGGGDRRILLICLGVNFAASILYGGAFAMQRDIEAPVGPATLGPYALAAAILLVFPILAQSLALRRKVGFFRALPIALVGQALLLALSFVVLSQLQLRFGIRIFT